MGADYSFYVKTIETHARAFLTLNILPIGRVYQMVKTYNLRVSRIFSEKSFKIRQ